MTNETCRNLLEGLSLFVDGEAAPELCAEIERHLAGCPDCRIVVDTLKKTVDLYHRLPRPDMPGEVREKLYKSLDLSEYMK